MAIAAIACAMCLLGASPALGADAPARASVTLAPLPGAARGGPPVVRWSTGNGRSGEVRVSHPGRPETTLALGPSGAEPLPWMRPEESYVIRLYASGTDHRRLASFQVDPGRPTRSTTSRPAAAPRAPGWVSPVLQVLPWITVCLLLALLVAYARDERSTR